MPIRGAPSLAARLVRIVFSLYLLVAALVVAVQMADEYLRAQATLEREVSTYVSSIEPGLADALWSIDTEAIRSIASGMTRIPTIAGVRIRDHSDSKAPIDAGYIAESVDNADAADRVRYAQPKGELGEQRGEAPVRLDVLSTPVFVRLPEGRRQVGELLVYTDTRLLWKRLYRPYGVMLIGALVKMLVLWAIFVLVVRQLLGKPLRRLSRAMNTLHLQQMMPSDERPGAAEGDELQQMQRAFDRLQARLAQESLAHQTLRAGLEDEVLRRTQELEDLNRRLTQLATTDGLTGALTRRQVLELGGQELARSLRHHSPLSVAMLDLDHFKRINDTFGHAAGDGALREFVARARDCLRAHDVIGRMGGEEFLILLPETALDGALDVAERLREAVCQIPVVVGDCGFTLTVSIGVAELNPHQASLERLVASADKALYAAKHAGRNRVLASPDSLHSLPGQDAVTLSDTPVSG